MFPDGHRYSSVRPNYPVHRANGTPSTWRRVKESNPHRGLAPVGRISSPLAHLAPYPPLVLTSGIEPPYLRCQRSALPLSYASDVFWWSMPVSNRPYRIASAASSPQDAPKSNRTDDPESNRLCIAATKTAYRKCDLILVHATGIEPVQPKATALQAAYLSKDRTYIVPRFQINAHCNEGFEPSCTNNRCSSR
jgi:hypothetical protein